MADTHETTADVIAWLRRPREGENAYLTAWRDEIADRLEAAHTRDCARIAADALAVGGIVEAERKRESGDAAKLREAKLREAVKAVVDVGYPHNFQHEAPHISGYCYEITGAIEKCFDALAATEQEEGAK